ncbi:hypothetical protein BD309DRAFT_1083226 [Dichomitus squalens]|uniref:Uncharacterized protein n=1 Tax=Dichomitus squalens TaxID=114155 RepID=A0A4Q9Q2L8_9APHY|nr:hypothetical protein BD309DRAFT_1083226 [Dichomitus squalens]TBU61369.1 hypothetical protein BD310DRAFT_975037 [Dichomitus squalens]
MLEAEEDIRRKPRVLGDTPDMEYVVLLMLLWSDATQLSSFGSAALWPIYLYFGNLSKYFRGRPTEFMAHHLAYIPVLPDALKDFYMATYGTSPSVDKLKFCKRELFQKIWLLLLDAEFMHTYEHGIVLTCGDGVVRRIFPRIFTYSADYPEKVLIAALRPLANCLCPRCLIPKDKVAQAGTKADERWCNCKRQDTDALRAKILRARKNLFKGYSITGKMVTSWLNAESLTPIQSAFSIRFSAHNVNFYDILAPDLMHEFELGVWKGIFIHLMRILADQGDNAIEEFNGRMRRMPTFGRDRIRRFWHDVSSRKRLAARDYEAFLLTIMPAFEGLLDLRDDQIVSDLLFELANWHALAKLRLHTSVTLDIFRSSTKHMYDAIHKFAENTCPRYQTKELPSEATTRVQRAKVANARAQPSGTRRPIAFKVHHTYKFHALGDFPDYIQRSGPSDNYNTQVGELEHRHVKRFYARTNRITYEIQIAQKERKRSLLASIREKDSFRPLSILKHDRKTAEIASAEAAARALGLSAPAEHHVIPNSQRDGFNIWNFLDDHETDPAIKDFAPLLRQHLVQRLLGADAAPEDGFSDEQTGGVQILDDRLYQHKTICINYTTYDMRREQDTINPRTHADVMLLSSDSNDDTYWYARVLNIFHAHVRYAGPGCTRATQKMQRVEFMWVRWFERDLSYKAGFQHRRLPRLQFLDANDPDNVSFGFVDPDDILRAAYLIPAFEHGGTTELLGPSKLARRLKDDGDDDDDDDWCYLHVCMWATRDIFMRHLGGGVGHRGIGNSIEDSKENATRRSRRGRGRKKAIGARVGNTAQPLPQDDSDESDVVSYASAVEDNARSEQEKGQQPDVGFIGGEDSSEEPDDPDGAGKDMDAQTNTGADFSDHESEMEQRDDTDDEADDSDGEQIDGGDNHQAVVSELEDSEEFNDNGSVDTVYAAEGFAPL